MSNKPLFCRVAVLVFGLFWASGKLLAESEFPEEHVPFMTGGAEAEWGEFPSAVSIDSPYHIHCGGVIVDRQHVVTSAQCVLNATHQLINPFWLRVIAGDINLSPSSIRRAERGVVRIYVHDRYNPHSRANDVAVLRLDAPFVLPANTIEPALRTYLIKRDGLQCRLAGWGAQTRTENVAGVIVNQRVIAQNILSRDDCNVPGVHRNRVLESMICAGSISGTNPQAGPCSGNLGTGLYCEGELTGILTFGVNCGETNNPGVYTQIRFFNHWIDYQITRNDTLPLGWSPVPGQ